MKATFCKMVDRLVALAGQKKEGKIDWKALPYYETVFPYPPNPVEAKMMDVAFLAAVQEVGSSHSSYKVQQQDGSTVIVAVVGADADDVEGRLKRFCDDRGWTGYPKK